MLPSAHRIAFLIFAAAAAFVGAAGVKRVVAHVRRGPPDTDRRNDWPVARLLYALRTTLLQSRTFRKRPVVGVFHSFLFYGFIFYIAVNSVDALEGYFPFTIGSASLPGALYNLCADVLSALVLAGVVGLLLRRFLLPARRDFSFNSRTLLNSRVRRGAIVRDSLIVSAFILFHVGSRVLGSAAWVSLTGPDRYRPFATAISLLIPRKDAAVVQIFGYWGALGSVLVFLSYFPFTKHLHIIAAPLKYFFGRSSGSGTLPAVDLADESRTIGAARLDELAWPRLLDAYACIQCNRCQDVCPASATGKALSPAALEINKRMEMNRPLSAEVPLPLLSEVLTPEALWACTTCGACMEVCPVQDEPMLDIIDIRRHQVMMAGEFPMQLQSAFRGMERAKNPWGIGADRRLDWAEGLDVKTIEEKPNPDVLYWVGCAASYDPQAQKTARSFVQLMNLAGVDFAVLGKRECCTGDSARRAGNEHLYQQLAVENVAMLNEVGPKQIVVTCPHCLNSLGNEYSQLGGQYQVVHHTTFLDSLVTHGLLPRPATELKVTYHDPCYLGRHNGVYDAPRNLLRVLGQEFVEMERTRENSFCCGAGGAQFWKEEEPGDERISANRYREAQRTLGSEGSVLAVGCPFCKSMLESSPGREEGPAIEVKDIAELMLAALTSQKSDRSARLEDALLPAYLAVTGTPMAGAESAQASQMGEESPAATPVKSGSGEGTLPAGVEGRKWQPIEKAVEAAVPLESASVAETSSSPSPLLTPIGPDAPKSPKRKAWTPKKSG